MRVGIHAGSSSADEIAASCRDAGVNEIFLGTGSVPGASDRGFMTSDDFNPFRDLLQERDVQVCGMIAPPPSKEAVLGENESELDALCRTLRGIGESGIDVVLFYPLDRLIYFNEYHPGRPLMVMPGEDGWDTVIQFFRRVVGVADEVNLRLANHLWAVDVLHSIWDTVKSPNNGVTYCQGMSLFGEDPHSPVETWGMDRIFFCHARNQARHGQVMMDHDEVPLDSGDVDIPRCVRALMKAEYDGLIIPEHLGPQSIPDAVVYLKGLIDG